MGLMLALYTACLIATLAASKPVASGLLLIGLTALLVFMGTRWFGLNAYIEGLALLLNGFFAAIFILTGVIIMMARKVLK
jgi:hypothetical protein